MSKYFQRLIRQTGLEMAGEQDGPVHQSPTPKWDGINASLIGEDRSTTIEEDVVHELRFEPQQQRSKLESTRSPDETREKGLPSLTLAVDRTNSPETNGELDQIEIRTTNNAQVRSATNVGANQIVDDKPLGAFRSPSQDSPRYQDFQNKPVGSLREGERKVSQEGLKDDLEEPRNSQIEYRRSTQNIIEALIEPELLAPTSSKVEARQTRWVDVYEEVRDWVSATPAFGEGMDEQFASEAFQVRSSPVRGINSLQEGERRSQPAIIMGPESDRSLPDNEEVVISIGAIHLTIEEPQPFTPLPVRESRPQTPPTEPSRLQRYYLRNASR